MVVIKKRFNFFFYTQVFFIHVSAAGQHIHFTNKVYAKTIDVI